VILKLKENFLQSPVTSDARSKKLKRNIAGSLLVKGGSIAIGLVLIPMTIHYVSPPQYGIWLTLSSIIGWFSFFDIGFGHGLRNKFAEAVAKGDVELAKTYVSTTYAILTLIVTAVFLLFFAINPFLNWSAI
jgi:O-antigen/teichoic acid export membrane protein